MNSFELMNKQGLEVQEIVKKHLEGRGHKVTDVSQDRAYQKKDVDFILQKNGLTATLEVKKDKKLFTTGNIFIECGFQRGDYYSRGWIQYCEADYICYYDTTAAKGIVINRYKLLPLLEQGKKPQFYYQWRKPPQVGQ